MPTPPPQPTLRDGSLVLRPWTDADLSGLRRGALDSGWFETDSDAGGSADAGAAEALVRWQAGYDDDRSLNSVLIEVDGNVVGGMLLRSTGADTAELSWQLFKSDAQLLGAQAVQVFLRHAFDDLGVVRIETRIAADDLGSGRIAARAGMLKEGTARAAAATADGRVDQVIFARLATDPSVSEWGSFARVLNTTLPTKRAIAQALIRNDAGEVLLCQPTYKRFWDLPGGVVDPAESPATAVLREVREELSLDGTVRSLAAVTWLPPWRGWDDATLFVFDVRVTSEPGALQPREIKAVHWRAVADVGAHTADYTARLIERSVRAIDDGTGAVYLENAHDPSW
ncbi:NUDIX hydrolase [Allobranchiibius sp. GilTou38]|uniref:NUDIX hydrolase n=1 Tax=Allobranchiibius sp. GilTou38 TaxID=2815210 RepID=UPI001AA1AF88|nr:NUDIX hydrolase [Allobranchiibius sp. GilTou38]MBO1765408.1 NUDIX hydrolase [Allobranchiibius sp. GilTou38]